jgi:hypothetical protein
MTADLSAFLLARVSEDEAVAQTASPGGWSYGDVDSVAGGTLYDETRTIASLVYEQPADHDGAIVRHLLAPEADANGIHIARHDPARVLAQCAALREVVAAHELTPYYGLDRHGRWLPSEGEPKFWYCDCESGDGMIGRDGPCSTLRALATIWSDHPDYRPEEWA